MSYSTLAELSVPHLVCHAFGHLPWVKIDGEMRRRDGLSVVHWRLQCSRCLMEAFEYRTVDDVRIGHRQLKPAPGYSTGTGPSRQDFEDELDRRSLNAAQKAVVQRYRAERAAKMVQA